MVSQKGADTVLDFLTIKLERECDEYMSTYLKFRIKAPFFIVWVVVYDGTWVSLLGSSLNAWSGPSLSFRF